MCAAVVVVAAVGGVKSSSPPKCFVLWIQNVKSASASAPMRLMKVCFFNFDPHLSCFISPIKFDFFKKTIKLVSCNRL